MLMINRFIIPMDFSFPPSSFSCTILLVKQNDLVLSLIMAQSKKSDLSQVQLANFAAAFCLARIRAEFLQASVQAPPSKSSLQFELK